MSPTRRRIAAGGALVVAVAAIVAIVLDPFATPSGEGGIDNGSATSLATVERRDLASQTQVAATLGYADATSIVLLPGTSPADVTQARQQLSTARATLQSAEATLRADRAATDVAQATLAADRRKLAVDCAGDAAASSAGNCSTDAQTVATDEQAAAAARTKVAADGQQRASARTAYEAAAAAAAATAATESGWGQTSAYTWLPKVGDVVRRDGTVYAIGNTPAILLYGTVAPWRPFAPAMSPGRDVAELNLNLARLGYGAPHGDAYDAAAVEAFQRAHGLAPTGRLPIGSVVFAPGAIRVTSVTPAVGAAAQSGPVLGVTSLRRVVTIQLDASAQTSIEVGDPVTITLPDGSTTPGRVTSVGTVATAPSGDSGGSSTPTIEVEVTPTHPAATGRLDQAPVDVAITTDTARGVLVAPVGALLALAGGGYALETEDAAGAHRLVAVQVGLFDDAQGLVEVSGQGVRQGLRVVVPGT